MQIPFPDSDAAAPGNLSRYESELPDPATAIGEERLCQSNRVLNHIAKAIVTRTAIERSHTRERDAETHNVREMLLAFSDEPFGFNKSRDSMRFGLEQSLMGLARESREAEKAFWGEIWTVSTELLKTMEEHERFERRSQMIGTEPAQKMPARIP